MITKFYQWLRGKIAPDKEKNQYSAGTWPARVRCEALARTRELTGRLIDVGCGEGLFATKLAAEDPRLSVIGIDPDEGRLQLCLQRCRELDLSNIAVTRGSAAAMPFIDGYFDAATFINVLFNLDSLQTVEEALKETARIMRPGGVLFLDFRNRANILVNVKYLLAPLYDATIRAQNLPLKTYTLKEITAMLVRCGFKITKTKPLGFPNNDFAPIIFVEAQRC